MDRVPPQRRAEQRSCLGYHPRQARDTLGWHGTWAEFLGSQGRAMACPAAAGVPSTRHRALAVAPDGALWIGSDRAGVSRLEPRKRTA